MELLGLLTTLERRQSAPTNQSPASHHSKSEGKKQRCSTTFPASRRRPVSFDATSRPGSLAHLQSAPSNTPKMEALPAYTNSRFRHPPRELPSPYARPPCCCTPSCCRGSK